jgi:hypothetical protein
MRLFLRTRPEVRREVLLGLLRKDLDSFKLFVVFS